MHLTEKEVQHITLTELQNLLIQNDKSLKYFHDMPVPNNNIISRMTTSMVQEELNFNKTEQKKRHEELFSQLNSKQQKVYASVIDSITNSKGKVFFLYGPGETGKTYVYITIISKLRSERAIVLPFATSGIAATLLPGGRTAHFCFKIPLELHDQLMCDIKPNTMLA